MLKKTFFYLIIFTLLLAPFFSLEAAYEPQPLDPETPAQGGESIQEATGLGGRSPIDTTVLIINWALTILGVFFLCLVIYGGVIWMLSRGNEEEVTKATNIIKAAVIGIIVILVSYGITSFIFNVVANISQVD